MREIFEFWEIYKSGPISVPQSILAWSLDPTLLVAWLIDSYFLIAIFDIDPKPATLAAGANFVGMGTKWMVPNFAQKSHFHSDSAP